MKKLLARLLVLAMAVSMTAVSFAGAALAEDDLREKDLVTLEVVMMASAGKDGSGDVVDAINAYLEEKLNIHINLTFISYGNYTQPVSYTHLDVYKRQGEECLHRPVPPPWAPGADRFGRGRRLGGRPDGA